MNDVNDGNDGLDRYFYCLCLMPLPRDPPDLASCCSPGDITVTKVHSGYLIGRALPELGPGPWWEYIAIVSTFTEAASKALALAEASHTHAWLHRDGDNYEVLPKG